MGRRPSRRLVSWSATPGSRPGRTVGPERRPLRRSAPSPTSSWRTASGPATTRPRSPPAAPRCRSARAAGWMAGSRRWEFRRARPRAGTRGGGCRGSGSWGGISAPPRARRAGGQQPDADHPWPAGPWGASGRTMSKPGKGVVRRGGLLKAVSFPTPHPTASACPTLRCHSRSRLRIFSPSLPGPISASAPARRGHAHPP